MTAAAIEIKGKGLAKFDDAEKFLARLGRGHRGKWVAILRTGEVVAGKSVEAVYSEANKRSAKIAALFYAPKKGELLLRYADAH